MQFYRKSHVAISALAAVFILTACGNRKAKDETAKAEDYIAALALDTLPCDSLDTKYATQMLPAGSIIPELALPTPEGDTLRLSNFRGQWVVIDFWASWCPDCRADIPNVLRLYETYASRGVAFVGISFDDNAEAWQQAIEKYALPYPQASELRRMRDSETAAQFGIKWIPSLYLVTPDGRVALGTVLSERMERALEQVANLSTNSDQQR